MWCVHLPDKIQEGISRADLFYLLRLGELVLHSSPGANSEHHSDTDDHGNDSGGGIVDNCPHSHFPRSTTVQSCHTCKTQHTIRSEATCQSSPALNRRCRCDARTARTTVRNPTENSPLNSIKCGSHPSLTTKRDEKPNEADLYLTES